MNAGRKVVFHKNNMCNRSIYKLHTGFYPRNLGRIGAAVSEQAAGLAPRARTHIFGEARERTDKRKIEKSKKAHDLVSPKVWDGYGGGACTVTVRHSSACVERLTPAALQVAAGRDLL